MRRRHDDHCHGRRDDPWDRELVVEMIPCRGYWEPGNWDRNCELDGRLHCHRDRGGCRSLLGDGATDHSRERLEFWDDRLASMLQHVAQNNREGLMHVCADVYVPVCVYV